MAVLTLSKGRRINSPHPGCTHTHTHSYTEMQIHAHTHSHSHTLIHRDAGTCTHTLSLTHIHTQRCRHTHTHSHSHTLIHRDADTHTHSHTITHTQTCTHMHTHAHTSCSIWGNRVHSEVPKISSNFSSKSSCSLTPLIIDERAESPKKL